MKILRPSDKRYAAELRNLNRTYNAPEGVSETVREILNAVRAEGDAALSRYTHKFGGPLLKPSQFPVCAEEIDAAMKETPVRVRRALQASLANVLAFAKKGLRKTWFRKNREGATVGERFDPFERVGLYIPGGSAPLVSTVIMTAGLARAAGVPEIVVMTPCGPDGKINPALLTALSLCGVSEIYRLGGAQAVGALAFGTKSIRPVKKIFGPGNNWVVEAKRQLFGRVAIDLLPGPSEVLVIADDSARPDWIAADLLAQSEHGVGSVGILLTDSETVLVGVESAIKTQLASLSRRAILAKALKNLRLVLVESLAEAVRIANAFAPEHVSIVTREPENIAASLNSSGAIFLGHFSPVAAGDFLAGPSHTLPTGGAGKSFAGLTVDQFQRRTSIVRYDRESLARSMETIKVFGEVEGLDAHTRSASIRLES